MSKLNVIPLMKHDVQKFEQKSSRFERSDQSTSFELQIITILYNKTKLLLQTIGNGMAQQLLVSQGKKRIYSSYANCNDSWFFFEGHDSTRA